MSLVLARDDRANIRMSVERLIESGLARRNLRTAVEPYGKHPTSGRPNYVHRMCEELLAFCRQHGASSVSLEDILRIDMLCSGHCDYFSKFSLRLTELCIGDIGPHVVRN